MVSVQVQTKIMLSFKPAAQLAFVSDRQWIMFGKSYNVVTTSDMGLAVLSMDYGSHLRHPGLQEEIFFHFRQCVIRQCKTSDVKAETFAPGQCFHCLEP
jgi:hypothetical protein